MTPGDHAARPNRLREYRAQYRLTEAQVAAKLAGIACAEGIVVGIDAVAVSKHETGKRRPGPVYRYLYCRLYDVTEADLGFRPALPAEPVGAGAVAHNAHSLLEFGWTQRGTVELAVMLGRAAVDRRAFMLLSGATLTAPAHHWLIQEPEPLLAALGGDRVSPQLAARFPPMIATFRQMEDVQGGGLILQPAKELFAWITKLLDKGSYSATTGVSLHRSLAELGQLAGWCAYDAGHDALAQHFFVAALRAAHTAGDRALGAHVLGSMAAQARDSRPRDAVTLIDTAVAGSRGANTPGLLALLHMRAARAHAALGDTTACDRAITRARSEIERLRTDHELPYLYYISPAQTIADAGAALCVLGRADRALPLVDEGLSTADDSFVRDRAYWLTYKADAAARPGPQRDLDLAVEQVSQALDLTDSISSATCTGRIHDVCRRLSAHRGHARVRDLLERVRSTAAS